MGPEADGQTPSAGRPFASQAGRLPAALTGARLDARGPEDLVAEAAKIAGLIRFDETATWQELLNVDAVPSLALLATVGAHARLRAAAPTRGGAEARLRDRVEALFALAAEVDLWLAPLEGAQGHAGLVRATVERVIVDVLAPRMRRMRDHVAEVAIAGLAADGLTLMERRLAARWRFGEIAEDVRRTSRAIEDDAYAKAVVAVEDACDAFVRELTRVASRSRAAFAAALLEPEHAPHVALLMAFAGLLRHAQGWVNAVPMRIVDHYETEVLREAPRGAEPDAALLVAVRKPASNPSIPRGAEFAAGQGADGRSIVFAAEHHLHVTGAVLAAARVWRPGRAKGASSQPVELAALVPEPGGLLGKPERGIAEAKTLEAQTALVVASSAFGAVGASKRILIVIEQAEAAAVTIEHEQVAAAVSGAQGWISGVQTVVTPHANRLAVELRFDATSPLLAVGPPGVLPDVEAVRLTFGQASAALSGAALKQVWAYVTLTDAAAVSVCDADDPAGGSVAAAPFGSPPFVGRRMRIDHPGLTGSDLRRVALGLTWDALPPTQGGFADHYRQYVVDRDGRVGQRPLLDNASFKVSIVTPLAERPSADLPLFQVQSAGDAERIPDMFADDETFAGSLPADPPASGPLAKTSWFAFEAPLDGAAERGPDHMTVELTAPLEGFGDALYPANVAYTGMLTARAMMPPGPSRGSGAGAQAAAGGDASIPVYVLPSPPWRPALKAVRLDYARFVTTGSRVGALKLLHDMPGEGLSDVTAAPGHCVLPALPRGPTLDIGLRGLGHHRALSLLFCIAPATAGDAGGSRPAWSYRRAGGWQPMDLHEARPGYEGPPAVDAVVDGTDGLRATGLVGIGVPEDAAPDGSGLVWFRAALGASAEMPAVTAVVPDAFSVKRVLSDPRDPLVPVPAGTITKAPSLPGLARLDQPAGSTGGRPPERADDIRRRTTERLRHRQRATRVWDVERIVLAACPDVFRVRVGAAAAGGRLRVVAVPASPDPRPQFTPARREEIRALITASASPFAEVEVLAPRYRDVDVEADVVMDPALDPIDAVSQLRLAIEDLLSPQAVPGLHAEDLASPATLWSALRAFIAGRPSVKRAHVRKAGLHFSAGETAPGLGFADVPVAGAVTLVPVLSSDAESWP